MGFFEFIQNNLGHVTPLILSAIFAAAIIAERSRAIFFTYPMKNSKVFFDKITQFVMKGATSEAVALCDQNKEKPLARVVRAALVRAHLPEQMIQHGLEYEVGEASHTIRKRTAFLATIANVATLLGLFGTILGLIHSFEAVGHADAQQKSALLAAGIATAMNATMFGLGIAIPCMVVFSFLQNKSNRLISELENNAVKTVEILQQRYYAMESGVAVDEWDEESSDDDNVVPIRRNA